MADDARFPFAKAEAFKDGLKWLGGEIVIIPGGTAANVNYTKTHHLKRTPRALLLLDVGTNAIAGPIPRGTSVWSPTQFSLNLPTIAAAQPLTALLI